MRRPPAGRMRPAAAGACSGGLLDDGDRVAGGDRAALGNRQLLHLAASVRGDLVLHLHRLDDRDERALLDLGALRDGDAQDRPLKRRDELLRTGAAGARGPLAALRGLASCARPARCRSPSPRRRSRLRRSGARRPRPHTRAPRATRRPPAPARPGPAARTAGATPCPRSGRGRSPRCCHWRVASSPLWNGISERTPSSRNSDSARSIRARGVVAVDVPDDQLRHHRVVQRRDLRARSRRPSRRGRRDRTARRRR